MKKSCDFKVFEDPRGKLTTFNSIEPMNVKRFYLIEPEVSFWRGKHYHKVSTQLISVLSGKLKCSVFWKDSPEESNEFLMLPGDTYLQSPGLTFTFCSVEENTKLLVMCDTEFDSSDYYEV